MNKHPMKTSTLHSIKKTAALFALVLTAMGSVSPLAARADGDTDRWAIADFYNSLDARNTRMPEAATAASSPSPSRGAAHVGFNKMVRRSKAATSRRAAAR